MNLRARPPLEGRPLPLWIRLSRPRSAAAILLALVLGVGTLGYMIVEGWGLWDSVYMTVITVTTVGYREVHELSRAGQVFTVILLIGGVGTVFYTVTLFVARIVEAGVEQRWQLRRRERMLDELKDHFIICGFGRIGSTIADEFRRHGTPFVVIDKDPDKVHDIIMNGGLAVAADASTEEVLRRVGIERARGLIAAVNTDAENVYTILSARLMRPNLFIIGRAETEDARRKLTRAGADRVISPYQLGAVQMAQTALRPAVVDFVHLATSSDYLDLSMEQVGVRAGGALGGKTIVGANIRQRYGVIIVGIQRANGRMEFNPPAEAVMEVGDQLVVLGPPNSLKKLEADAEGEETR